MVGREQEIKNLNRLYDRNKAELVAIYGRRRVGKTFLVDEVFADRITFRHADHQLQKGKKKDAKICRGRALKIPVNTRKMRKSEDDKSTVRLPWQCLIDIS